MRDNGKTPSWFYLVLALLACLMMVIGAYSLVKPKPASAHGEADWIRQGDFRDSLGNHCCGPADCERIPESAVEVTPEGFRYLPTNESIPWRETRPSPDGNYWRCHYYEQGVQHTRRKCFWRPSPPS